MSKLTPFGKEIRKLRIDHDKTQSDVATVLGVSVAFWSAIETGKKNISSDLMAQVVAHFELSKQQEQKLKDLSFASQKEVKINMENSDDRSRRLVAGFARKFDSLNEAELESMRKLLGIGDD